MRSVSAHESIVNTPSHSDSEVDETGSSEPEIASNSKGKTPVRPIIPLPTRAIPSVAISLPEAKASYRTEPPLPEPKKSFLANKKLDRIGWATRAESSTKSLLEREEFTTAIHDSPGPLHEKAITSKAVEALGRSFISPDERVCPFPSLLLSYISYLFYASLSRLASIAFLVRRDLAVFVVGVSAVKLVNRGTSFAALLSCLLESSKSTMLASRIGRYTLLAVSSSGLSFSSSSDIRV